MTAEELARTMAVGPDRRTRFLELLDTLESDGVLVQTRTGRYGLPERMNLVVGTLDGHPGGFGFVVPDREDQGPDIYVPAESLGGAMHGDRVIARPGRRKRPGAKNPEGEVIRILKRANHRVVGTLERKKHFGFVAPDERRLGHDIFVAKEDLQGAGNGDRVVVDILEWPQGRHGPTGRIVRTLGRVGDPEADTLAIIYKHDLRTDFPPEALRQGRAVPASVSPQDLAGRLDLRDRLVVTIDGEDARDFDDAVSVEVGPSPGVRWRLGVHIADVDHYVTEGSPLDREARRRGCSTYLVGRVIPMLPEGLSNGICSLNPRVDRLTVSVSMDFDDQGKLIRYSIEPSVIRSAERMTYTNVHRLLAGERGGDLKGYEPLLESFRAMERLARRLQQRRTSRGSIDFDFPEARVILDRQGRVTDLRREPRTIAHQIIEEFMLAANETVAGHCERLDVPALYRIHEEPDPEDLTELNRILALFGHKLRLSGKVRSMDVQAVLNAVRDRPEATLVGRLVLRTLKQARYSPRNTGHFGLAAPVYTHFTSPIRRYPDLVVHRILKALVSEGEPDRKRSRRLTRALPNIARIASARERVSEEAERDSVDLRRAEYMSRHLEEVFAGKVSGVTSFGFFVELENTAEGLVHVSRLTDDYYIFDEKHYALVGERSRRAFRFGDEVRVRVVKVNPVEHSIDFELE